MEKGLFVWGIFSLTRWPFQKSITLSHQFRKENTLTKYVPEGGFLWKASLSGDKKKVCLFCITNNGKQIQETNEVLTRTWYDFEGLIYDYWAKEFVRFRSGETFLRWEKHIFWNNVWVSQYFMVSDPLEIEAQGQWIHRIMYLFALKKIVIPNWCKILSLLHLLFL